MRSKTYKSQWECIGKQCVTKIVGPEFRLDGLQCPKCNSPVVNVPYDANAEHIHISEARKLRRNRLLQKNEESKLALEGDEHD